MAEAKGILGTKLGMTEIFTDDSRAVPVTVIQAGPCVVTQIKTLERDVSRLERIQAPFPRMSYDDAVKILQSKGSEIQWGGDFGGADETILTQDEERPLMVDKFPTEIKAFYFQPDPERPEDDGCDDDLDSHVRDRARAVRRPLERGRSHRRAAAGIARARGSRRGGRRGCAGVRPPGD